MVILLLMNIGILRGKGRKKESFHEKRLPFDTITTTTTTNVNKKMSLTNQVLVTNIFNNFQI